MSIENSEHAARAEHLQHTDSVEHAVHTAHHVLPAQHEDADGERWARITWSLLAEPDDALAHAVCTQLGPVAALDAVRAGDSGALVDSCGGTAGRRIAEGMARWSARLAQVRPEEVLEQANGTGMRVLVPGDEEWPQALDDLGPGAPHCLWVHGPGSLPALSGARAVSVVGSRAATTYGEDCAAALASQLAADGCAVISGGAYGIDAAAHRGALAARGGETVAVLAGGLDRLYPRGNARMLELIRERCLLVSEAPPGTSPTRWRFLSRNRLIAALGAVTVVVEASWRSGALATANRAAEIGRSVAAVPGPVTSAASAGCHRLIREGQATLVTEMQDIRELLPGAAPAGDSRFARSDELDLLSPADHRICAAVPARSWTTAERIAGETGLPLPEVQGALGRLALLGLLAQKEERVRRAP